MYFGSVTWMIKPKSEIQGPIATATFFRGKIHVLLECEYAQRNWVFQICITLVRVTKVWVPPVTSCSVGSCQFWGMTETNTCLFRQNLYSASDCLLWALCQGIFILADKLLPEPFCWISFVCIAQHFTGWGTGMQMLTMLLFCSDHTKKTLKLWRAVTYNALAGTK